MATFLPLLNEVERASLDQRQVLPPSIVAWEGKPFTLTLRLPATRTPAPEPISRSFFPASDS